MIEVPQLWLPDRLRERREDERLMRGRGGLSRRWMPGYPCCPRGCLLFEDDFEREDIGDDWEVTSGDWSIDSGRLTSSDASAKICIEAGSQKINELEGSVVVDCVIPRVNGANVRVYTSASDYVELTFTSTQVAANINGGTPGTWQSVGATGSFRVCHSNRYIVVVLDGTTVLKSNYSDAVPGKVCAGFGGDAGGGSSGFESFTVSHGVTKYANCPHCAICALCPSLPAALEVTLSGITLYEGGARDANDCTPSLVAFVNDTFILQPTQPCTYEFGCVIPVQCRESEEDPYVDVWFWVRFRFTTDTFSGKKAYHLSIRSYWQPAAPYGCNEDTGQVRFSTDVCWRLHGGYDQFDQEDWTCEPEDYVFQNLQEGCPDVLDYSGATFKVTAI